MANKFSNSLTVLFALAILSFSSCSQLPSDAETYLVTLKVTPADNAQNLATRYNAKVLSFSPEAGFAILKVSQLPDSTDPKVQHIEKNSVLQTSEKNLQLGQPTPIQTSGEATDMASVGMSGWTSWSSGWTSWSSGWTSWSSGVALPTPPSQNNAMLQNTRITSAHAIARKYGEGVTVAVLDTGLDMNHLGVMNKLVEPARRWDFVDNDNNPSEISGAGYGHGTAVTGLVLQVAPNARIMPLRVLDQNGSGDLDNVVSAIDFAIRNNARIINISLGADGFSEALRTMISYAKSKQIYIIAAAGNKTRTDSANFPARMQGWWEGQGFLFSVGSLNSSDQVSWFSNRGVDVSFFAPGENLTTFAPNNRVMTVTGTSFATPLVTGAMALAYGETTDVAARNNLGTYLVQSLDKQSLWWSIYRNTSTPWQHSLGKLDVEHYLYSLPMFSGNAPRLGRQDFVLNGNFETNSTLGWNVSGARIETNPFGGGVYAGSSSMMLNNTGSAWQRLTDLQPNTTYKVTAWARVFAGNESAVIGVRNSGSTNASRAVTDSNAFQQVSMTFKTGISNRSADLYFEKTAGTSAAAADLFVVTRN